MKLLKKILERDSIYKWKVRSASKEGVFYIVRLLIDGELICDCIAGSLRQSCRHKQKVGKILAKRGIQFNVGEQTEDT